LPGVPVVIGSASSGFDSYGVAASGSLAVATGGSFGLKVVDVGDPTNPTSVGSLTGNFTAAAMNGRYAYVLNNPLRYTDPSGFDENTAGSPARDRETHLKHTINGRLFGNLHGLVARQGDRVRWYLVDLGNEVDQHTPHWHGEQLTLEGRTHADVVELLPGSMRTGDMVALNPGVWLLHCHVADHMMAGMFTTFAVTPATRARARR